MNIKLSLCHSTQLRLLHTKCSYVALQCNFATLPKPAVLGLNLKAQGRASRAEVMAINFCWVCTTWSIHWLCS